MGGIFWLITHSQINIAQGKLKYDILPTSIEGCDNSVNQTIVNIIEQAQKL